MGILLLVMFMPMSGDYGGKLRYGEADHIGDGSRNGYLMQGAAAAAAPTACREDVNNTENRERIGVRRWIVMSLNFL